MANRRPTVIAGSTSDKSWCKLSSFLPEKSARPCPRLLFQELNDEALVCWMGEWRERADLERFSSSETYRALRGAATVLGHLEEVQLVELSEDELDA